MTAAVLFASRSGRDWQAELRPFARNDAEYGVLARARLYMEVPS